MKKLLAVLLGACLALTAACAYAQPLEDLIVNRAKLWLDSGKIFGKSGEGFQRINVACPRQILEEALHRIKEQLQAV